MFVLNKSISIFQKRLRMATMISALIISVAAFNLSFSFVLSPQHNCYHNYNTNIDSSQTTSRSRSQSKIFLDLPTQSPTILNESNDKMKGGMNEKQQEQLDEDTIIRFRGVGRLYEQQQKVEDERRDSESHTEIISRLKESTVAIIGIGGVGSWAAESVCRSGVGNIILVDLDDICISNTNRQLHATSRSIGQMKTDVMRERLLDINPKCNVSIIHDFITEENVFDIVEGFQGCSDGCKKVDVIIDAIDGNSEKAALIAAACIKNIPIVTCGGAAGRTDPSQIVCQDLSQSVECKLLFWTKKKLRNHYRLFPNDKKKGKMKKWRLPAIFSMEVQKKVDEDSPSFRKCDGALGTACFVTGTYGMIAASQAINMIANDSFYRPRLIRSSVEYWNDLHVKSKETRAIEGNSSMVNSM